MSAFPNPGIAPLSPPGNNAVTPVAAGAPTPARPLLAPPLLGCWAFSYTSPPTRGKPGHFWPRFSSKILRAHLSLRGKPEGRHCAAGTANGGGETGGTHDDCSRRPGLCPQLRRCARRPPAPLRPAAGAEVRRPPRSGQGGPPPGRPLAAGRPPQPPRVSAPGPSRTAGPPGGAAARSPAAAPSRRSLRRLPSARRQAPLRAARPAPWRRPPLP